LIAVHNPNTGGGTGLCLEVHDLAVSKLIAGREKDLTFVASLLRNRLAEAATIQARLKQTALSEEARKLCQARVRRLGVSN
jgi:hypothetical protein